jgi:hypothetical protein
MAISLKPLSEEVMVITGASSNHAVKGFTDALRVEVQELDEAPVTITLIQQYDEPPRDRDGTLYKPGQSGHTRGSGPASPGAAPSGNGR